ncbi:ImmA/IrrE family metallo-endopeptidase [Leptospira vanthielii]|uniref:PF06114 domain protein n=1 Tax=Leptospira vanthielii serovar Holland str. Waz Holland = ATCC 700522 TaxID=1218591 RepID=N1WDT0_9LEPT|nr:hypothetical protein [Leptospira vanthielii]EMY71530.1 PF06114 domain protein [Leptospira vanthielii serovar Holland str. Waz Holland = ATCC 700522]
MKRNEVRLGRLLSIAEKEDVIVNFLDVERLISWKGLYVTTELGSAIGISSALTLENQVWVLAHELGHHFRGIQRALFSPFQYDLPGFNNPVEERNADLEGLILLDEEENWRNTEKRYPTDLNRLAKEMELPLDAALTRLDYLNSRFGNQVAVCGFSDELWESIQARTKGDGGAQSTVQKLVKRKNSSGTRITFREFNQLRKRAADMRGGFGKNAKQILAELSPEIKSVGGVFSFFGINET